jgi:hypothetical protein
MPKPRQPANATPTLSPRRGMPWLAWVVLALGSAVIAGAVWIYLRTPRLGTLEMASLAAVAEFQRGLPYDYGNGLVLETVSLQGTEIVMTIRSTRLGLDVASRDRLRFEQARRDEKAMMLPFCAYPEVRALLDQGITLRRRFLDTQGRLFFDITLAASDCQPGGPGA